MVIQLVEPPFGLGRQAWVHLVLLVDMRMHTHTLSLSLSLSHTHTHTHTNTKMSSSVLRNLVFEIDLNRTVIKDNSKKLYINLKF